MARQRTIVGLGETLLVEHPDRVEAAGLAARTALDAVRLGHVGVAVSRVGQDDPGRDLVALLAERGVVTSHVQSDPDLPTGRVVMRAIGGAIARYLDARAAFDNLQADFDLEDVAQQADAVIYGLLSRRGGQTRSEEDRFLEACSAAVKVFDLTNQEGAGDGGDAPVRNIVTSGMRLADGVVVDAASLDLLRPGDAGAPLPERAAALVNGDVSFSLVLDAAAGDHVAVTLVSEGGRATGSIPPGRPSAIATTTALVERLLHGATHDEALAFATRVGAFTAERPDEPIPGDVAT